MAFWNTITTISVTAPITAIGGLSVGDVVRHKVTGAKAVIVAFFYDEGREWATVSIGWAARDEFDTSVAELEPWREMDAAHV